MRGPGTLGGENNEVYEAELAEVLGRWEAERAKTADLQGRAATAAATAGLQDRLRCTAEAATLAQAELETARGELEAEKRGRDKAEREIDALRLQVVVVVVAVVLVVLVSVRKLPPLFWGPRNEEAASTERHGFEGLSRVGHTRSLRLELDPGWLQMMMV